MPNSPPPLDLSGYVDTRLKIIAEAMSEKLLARDQVLAEALTHLVEKTGLALTALRETAIASDLRYRERFEAQQAAMQALLASQKTATELAMSVSDRAFSTAERAVNRAADAVDARLTEIKVGAEARTASLASRLDALEARMDISTGETSGGARNSTNSRSLVVIVLSVLALAASVAFNIFNAVKS